WGNGNLDKVTFHFAQELTVTGQPESAQVKHGQSVSFSVTADGESLTYQWQFSKNGVAWSDVGTSISGSRADTMTFKGAVKYNGYSYRCVVTDVRGESVTTQPAKLTVTVDAPVITAQPKDASASAGDEVSFTVTARGTNLKYQWRYSKDGSSWYNVGTSVSGSRTATLTFTAAKKYNNYQYRCNITDAAGNTALSGTAKLAVTATAPVITAQPQDASAAAGDEVSFTAAATGTGLKYQWRYSKDGSSWYNVGGTIPSAKTGSLTFTAGTKYNGYSYQCIVTDANGNKTATDIVKLTVN
ncbi:MAG: immunoglobulin domain-containing protein, partial [Oscillospiraceae bacterium]|nr:immunoglobulin domain-containing protein [Oscillospiraceae bacterium]